MKIKENFVLRTVCGENVVIAEGVENIDFSKIISLNETAAFLWKEAGAEEFTLAQLTEALCREYDVEAVRAEADVAEIVAQWKSEGLVTD